jgi:hypothetical protein
MELKILETDRSNTYFLTKTKHDDKIWEIGKFQRKQIDMFTLMEELAKQQFDENRKKAKNPEKWAQEKEQKKYQKKIAKSKKKLSKYLTIESEKHVETSSPAEQAGLWFLDVVNNSTLYVEFLGELAKNDPFPNVKKLAAMYIQQTIMLYMVIKRNFETMLKNEKFQDNRMVISDIINAFTEIIPPLP